MYGCSTAVPRSKYIARQSLCVVLSIPTAEMISIANFRRVPNSDRANNISYAFEVDPAINYRDPLTYDVEFHWEEGVRGYSGSSSNHYYSARGYYSRSCPETGNLRGNGWTYQFSVSKSSLGSGPLYVNVSVSLLCNESRSYYRYCSTPCYTWHFKGHSDTIRTDTIHGTCIHTCKIVYIAVIILPTSM